MIIYSIFAGRKEYLEILFVYLNKYLKNNTIDEVHLWDFCRNPTDSTYIRTIQSENVRIFNPGEYVQKYKQELQLKLWEKWAPYYAYYKNNLNDDDILIKSDDDILYIQNLDKFVNLMLDNRKYGLYFPNIVNNDVAFKFQCEYGIIPPHMHSLLQLQSNKSLGTPISNWYMRNECGEQIQYFFLKNKESFIKKDVLCEIHDNSRVSINFFGIHGYNVKKFFHTYLTLIVNPYSQNICKDIGDEPIITSHIQKVHKHINVFVMECVVVHYSFGPQNINSSNNLLIEYRREVENVIQ